MPRLLEGRLRNLLEAAATPGDNERLQFVRQIMTAHGIDLTSDSGQEQAWKYFVQIKDRVARENRTFIDRASAATTGHADATGLALAALYRDRGLSSDTSLGVDFAVDRALEDMKSARRFGEAQVRRVAIIGPGLDFSDKSEGYDFYPLQTIQPFALADSLARLGLAASDLSVTTLDVSARVNSHLSAARRHAQNGAGYVLQLPLETDRLHRRWDPKLEQYWERVGTAIGEGIPPIWPRWIFRTFACGPWRSGHQSRQL
jgi:hypothetical protein